MDEVGGDDATRPDGQELLIYCQRDGDAPPTSITVGAHQVRLDTSALALTGTPADIERRLQALADQVTQRTGLPAITG